MRTTRASSIQSLVTLLALALVASVSAFVSTLPQLRNVVPASSRLFMDESEKLLRQEVADRNVNTVDEDKYIVPDGENLYKIADGPSPAATGVASAVEQAKEDDTAYLLSKLERLTKPRAYPLFMAEKGAELIEATAQDIDKLLSAIWSKAGQVPKKERKEHLVVLGTGWGAASFVKNIDMDLYDVTVISPRNFFVYTPMLAGACVGTVEYRSITENILEINPKVKFLEATASNIDPTTNVVTCASVVCVGNSCGIENITVEYDRLIVTVGAQTNTFGIPGVREHCKFLKQVEDARRIRTALVNCFERANLPNLTDEERRNNLTFAVIGAGPTGIEFASELRDFVEQDGPKYYPQLLKFVRIKIIEASSTVLAPFDKSLQEEAIAILNESPRITDQEAMKLLPERFQLTELLLDSSVKEVTAEEITLGNGAVIRYGMAVWAAGNGPLPITLSLIQSLGAEQADQQVSARGRVAVDPWLRAIGGKGKIMVFGDCSCITKEALPATAQVAGQQGEYLASLMNRQFNLSPDVKSGVFLPPVKEPEVTQTSLSDSIAAFATNSYDYAKPFQFLNLGLLAYTGGSTALAQVTTVPNVDPVKASGKIGNFLWRSLSLGRQMSWRNRFLVVNDWVKRTWIGRDITRM